jgi:hypothetical protein
MPQLAGARSPDQGRSFVDSLVTWGIIPGMPDDSGLRAEDLVFRAGLSTRHAADDDGLPAATRLAACLRSFELPLGDLVARVLEAGREAEG